jgi:hypothetical protein
MITLLFLLAGCFDPEPPRLVPSPRAVSVPSGLEVDTGQDSGLERSPQP